MAIADPKNGYTNLAKIRNFSVTLVKPCWCTAVMKLPFAHRDSSEFTNWVMTPNSDEYAIEEWVLLRSSQDHIKLVKSRVL